MNFYLVHTLKRSVHINNIAVFFGCEKKICSFSKWLKGRKIET